MRWYPLPAAEARLLGAPNEVDELGSLSLSLDCEWRQDRIFVIVTTYVDETGLDGPRVLLAGFTARIHEWHGFANQWNKLLKKEGIPYSHMLEMRRRDPPFEEWDNGRLNAFARKATGLISKYCAFGLTVGVDKAVRASYAANMPPKTSPDSAYGMCARHFFEKVPEYAERVMGLPGARMNFVFERQDQRFGDAERIFHELKKVDPWFRDRLGTITPGEGADFAGLQAADMFAYFARRKEPETKFRDVPPPGEPVFRDFKRVACPLFRVDVSDEAVPLHHRLKEGIARRGRIQRSQAKKAAKKQPS